MKYNKHECTPQFKTLCDLIRTNRHSLWACKHIHTLKVKQLFKAGWELLLGGLQVWWVDTDRSQRISLSNTYTVLRYSEEAALVYASFGPNVMVWQAFLPLALPPLLSIPVSLPVHSSPCSPLPPSFLELMGLKASSSSLLKHAFNLIIYYLLFSAL